MYLGDKANYFALNTICCDNTDDKTNHTTK